MEKDINIMKLKVLMLNVIISANMQNTEKIQENEIVLFILYRNIEIFLNFKILPPRGIFHFFSPTAQLNDLKILKNFYNNIK